MTSASREDARPPRFPQLTMEQLTPDQKRVAEEILKVSSGGLGGPYNFLLRSPVLADRTLKLADYLRFNTSVPRRLNELAILIQARLWTAQYEWWAHYPLALKAGLGQAIADDLKLGKRPRVMQPDEEAVYDFCVELSKRHRISDATFKRARELLGEQQVVDLVALSGFYVQVSMILNVTEATIPNHGAPPLEPMDDPLPLSGYARRPARSNPPPVASPGRGSNNPIKSNP
jgi:4-carboxymuconolactone decarboxylase